MVVLLYPQGPAVEPAKNFCMEEKTVKNKKMSPLVYVFSGVLATVALVLIIGVGIVVVQVRNVSSNPTIIKIAGMINVSAAQVNGKDISYQDYIGDVQTLKRFYSSQGAQFPPVSDQDISDMTISRLVANTLIAELSKKYNVEVTDADLEAKKQELLASFEDQAQVDAELQANYGWNFDTYLQKVIRPLILEQKLQEAFSSSTDSAFANFEQEEVRARHILFVTEEGKDEEAVKKDAQSVLERLKKGEEFEKLAAEFGSDGTKDVGGDLGWFPKNAMVKEFADAAFALEKRQLSDLVKSEFGYHIIRVDDKRTGKDFISFMDNQIATADIDIFLDIHNPFDKLPATPSVTQ